MGNVLLVVSHLWELYSAEWKYNPYSLLHIFHLLSVIFLNRFKNW